MKFNFGLLFLFLHISFLSFAGKSVKLPSAEVLNKRITKIGLDYIIQETKFVDQLANKLLFPAEVAYAIDNVLFDFKKCLKPNKKHVLLCEMQLLNLNTRKFDLLEAILKDYPEALAEAKKFISGS